MKLTTDKIMGVLKGVVFFSLFMLIIYLVVVVFYGSMNTAFGVPNSIKQHRRTIERYHKRLKIWKLNDAVHKKALNKGWDRGKLLAKKASKSKSTSIHIINKAYAVPYMLSGSKRLEGVHPDLVSLVMNVGQITPILIPPYGGVRTQKEQNVLQKKGNSQVSNSLHLTGRAVDFVPYPGRKVNWNDSKGFVYVAGIFLGAWYSIHDTTLRWGGDWGKQGHPGCSQGKKRCFTDLGHVELPK